MLLCCVLLGTELRAVGHRGGAKGWRNALSIKHHSSEAVHVPKVKMNDWLNDLFNRKSWQTSGHWHHVSVSWSISRRPGKNTSRKDLRVALPYTVSWESYILWRSLCFATDGLTLYMQDFWRLQDWRGNVWKCAIAQGLSWMCSLLAKHLDSLTRSWHLLTRQLCIFQEQLQGLSSNLDRLNAAPTPAPSMAPSCASWRTLSFHICSDPEILRPCARAVRTATGSWGF